MIDTFMQLLLSEQGRLQRALGDPMFLGTKDWQVCARENLLAVNVEAAEILGEINWKPWKATQPAKKVDRAALLLELVDLLQFWANVVNAAGFSGQDVMDAYARKLEINYQRLRDAKSGQDKRQLELPFDRTEKP